MRVALCRLQGLDAHLHTYVQHLVYRTRTTYRTLEFCRIIVLNIFIWLFSAAIDILLACLSIFRYHVEPCARLLRPPQWWTSDTSTTCPSLKELNKLQTSCHGNFGNELELRLAALRGKLCPFLSWTLSLGYSSSHSRSRACGSVRCRMTTVPRFGTLHTFKPARLWPDSKIFTTLRAPMVSL